MATVRSKNYSTLASLDSSSFLEMQIKYPDIMAKFDQKIDGYKDKWKKFLLRGLLNVDFLSHKIDPHVLTELMFKLKPLTLGLG